MFNTGFQSSAASAKQMEYCVGSLTANPDFLEELRKELDGKVNQWCATVQPCPKSSTTKRVPINMNALNRVPAPDPL